MFTKHKKTLVDFYKFAAGGATGLTYWSWYKNMPDSKIVEEKLNSIEKHVDYINTQAEAKVNELSATNYKLFEKSKSVIDYLKELKNYYLEIKTESQNELGVSEDKLALYQKIWDKAFNDSLKKAEDLDKFIKDNEINTDIDDINNKFLGDNSNFEWFKQFNEFLSTLTTYQLCILMNITTSLFILGCLISMLFAFYGNFMIEKLSLEQKYPKLSGIIKLRIKFQHFYIITNSIFIVIALMLLSYVNFVTLFYL